MLTLSLWLGSVRAPRGIALRVIVVLLATAVLALSARIQIPFYPVPMTMQTFAVLMVGACLGARLGAAALVVYLAQGALGLPVFASGAGPAYLLGPTGGYLAGFVVAAAVAGRLAESGATRRLVSAVAVMLLAVALIYLPGVVWLAQITGSFEQAVSAGALPFLPGEAVKVVLAALAAWRFASLADAKTQGQHGGPQGPEGWEEGPQGGGDGEV